MIRIFIEMFRKEEFPKFGKVMDQFMNFRLDK